MKPTEEFGFEQAKQQYSLSSFQLKANQFKQDYFKMSVRVSMQSVFVSLIHGVCLAWP